MADDLALLSASELSRGYAARAISPREATEAALARIDRFNEAVNAFCLIDRPAAMAAAEASESRWRRGEPLSAVDGVPTSVKELMYAKGWPTRRCSRATSAQGDWAEDAPAVARLREAGAVLLGKTTSPEIGWKGVTDSQLFGITRNPWDVSKTPGGSSGGAAVAAALGMGALHLGTDGGGSIRMPAAFTGIFGLKPTYGRVPVYPLSTFGTMSHAGPMTRTVSDAALMMNVIARPDRRDWHALPGDNFDYTRGLDEGIAGLRVAFAPTLGFAQVDPEIARLVDDAAAALGKAGAQIERVDRVCDDPKDIFAKLWMSGCALAVRGLGEGARDVIDPGLRAFVEQGEAVPHMDYLAAEYARGNYAMKMQAFFNDFDLLLTPALPLPAFSAEAQVADPAKQRHWIDWTPFTYPFNLTRQPAASMPCGFTKSGLPVGLQIVGPLNADMAVLRAARAYEKAHPIVLPGAPRGGT